MTAGTDDRQSAPPPRDDGPRVSTTDELLTELEELIAVEQRGPNPDAQRRLIDLRLELAERLTPGTKGRTPWPPTYPDHFPDVVGAVPEVEQPDLTPELAGSAVEHHGALIVRGLFTSEEVERCVTEIDAAFVAREEREQGITGSASYRPVRKGPDVGVLRKLVGDQNGIWVGDSPAAAAATLNAMRRSGATDVVEAHLGSRPSFSLEKSTLRRSEPEWRFTSWHQDGAFLSPNVRTMNVWVALTACGGTRPTPGLEVVPQRVPEVLPTEGKLARFSVAEELVAEISDGPTLFPEFEAGDAIIFDHVFLHRTHLPTEMTSRRYAIECWFFCLAHQNEHYTPLLA